MRADANPRYTDTYSYSYSYSYSNSNSYSDGYSYSYSSAQADAYGEASWDPATAAIVGSGTIL